MKIDGYAVFMRCPERRGEVYEPTDFGIKREAAPDILLRRNRVAVFRSREDAEMAVRYTLDCLKKLGSPFVKRPNLFAIVPCVFRQPANPEDEQ